MSDTRETIKLNQENYPNLAGLGEAVIKSRQYLEALIEAQSSFATGKGIFFKMVKETFPEFADREMTFFKEGESIVILIEKPLG